MKKSPAVSIITPVLNESATLKLLYNQIREVMQIKLVTRLRIFSVTMETQMVRLTLWRRLITAIKEGRYGIGFPNSSQEFVVDRARAAALNAAILFRHNLGKVLVSGERCVRGERCCYHD